MHNIDPARWYALMAKPRQETRVAESLAARGLEVFLPSYRHRDRRSGRQQTRPFFPRYLFARFDWERTGWAAVQWTTGLSRVVTFDGRPAWLDEGLVGHWRERLARLDGDAFVRLKPGDRVRVQSGPFRDYEAVFDRHLNGESRVAILVDILGRKTSVQVPAMDVNLVA